jgi:hypothetical protein
LLSVYRDQTVDVSKARRWVVRFSSGDSDVRDRPHSGQPCTAVRKGVVLLDFLEPGQTINSDRYTKLKAQISSQAIEEDNPSPET